MTFICAVSLCLVLAVTPIVAITLDLVAPSVWTTAAILTAEAGALAAAMRCLNRSTRRECSTPVARRDALQALCEDDDI